MEGAASLELAKKIKEEMKDFYKAECTSSIDLQNTIKNRGFSYLKVNGEESETVVEIPDAQEIVDMYKENLTDLLREFPGINKFVQGLLNKWKVIKKHTFVKRELFFDINSTSSACFMGLYLLRGDKQLYIAYKLVKNAFRLAPDIFVVHETESESIGWGAFTSNSKVDRLVENNRGFNTQDLTLLLEMSSFAVLNFDTIKSIK